MSFPVLTPAAAWLDPNRLRCYSRPLSCVIPVRMPASLARHGNPDASKISNRKGAPSGRCSSFQQCLMAFDRRPVEAQSADFVRQITGSVYQLILPVIRIFLCNFARRRRRRNASSVYIMTSCVGCTRPTPDGWMLVTLHLPGSAILLAK